MPSFSHLALITTVLAALACAGPPSPQQRTSEVETLHEGEASRPHRVAAMPAAERPAPGPRTLPSDVPRAPQKEQDPKQPDPKQEPSSPSTDVVTVDRDELNRELQQVESISDVVGVRPNLTLQGMQGVTITSIPAGSPASRLGLRAGDVVHSVNGHQLNSIGSAMGAADELQGASSFTGEITRNGRRQTLKVVLQ